MLDQAVKLASLAGSVFSLAMCGARLIAWLAHRIDGERLEADSYLNEAMYWLSAGVLLTVPLFLGDYL